MKIFFLASVAVDEDLRKSYRHIVKILESLKNTVSAKHSLTLPSDIVKLTQAENEQRAKELLKEMLKSDCVVFEGTKATTGGGYYLSAALQRSIPVLYLSQEEYKGLYLASSNRLLKIKQYNPDNPIELKKIIADFLKFTDKKKLNNRFNLMISDSMDIFLDRMSRDYGISKADYIRDSVYRKMEEKTKK